MTLDMFVVSVVLVLVLLFFILLAILSRIWDDQSPRARGGDANRSQADPSAAVEMKKGTSRKESLA